MVLEFIKYFGLKLKSKGYYNVYDFNVDFCVINSFVVVVYRFGYSFV